MDCPYCGQDSRVLDSRGARDVVRRRRECLSCSRRFTTYERVAPAEIKVRKRDGGTEPFDRTKLMAIVLRLARGRPAGEKACEDLVRGLEAALIDGGEPTVTSGQISERLHTRLSDLDPVMAARFAANYTAEDGAARLADAAPSPQLALPLLGGEEVPFLEPPPPRAPRRRRS
jgi:transcriptional repressor NrdR